MGTGSAYRGPVGLVMQNARVVGFDGAADAASGTIFRTMEWWSRGYARTGDNGHQTSRKAEEYDIAGPQKLPPYWP